MKRSDLLILIAIWEFITALFAFIAVAAIAGFAFPDAVSDGDGADAGALFFFSVVTVLLLAFGGLAVAAGIGLIMGKEWGRISAIIHAALSLIRIPFGTIIGVLTLIYLLRTETRQYFQTAHQ